MEKEIKILIVNGDNIYSVMFSFLQELKEFGIISKSSAENERLIASRLVNELDENKVLKTLDFEGGIKK